MRGNIRVIAPVVYGLLIAVLAVLDVPWLGLAAVIGGVLLGLMFLLLVAGPRRTRTRG
jgi:hypothetical protein